MTLNLRLGPGRFGWAMVFASLVSFSGMARATVKG